MSNMLMGRHFEEIPNGVIVFNAAGFIVREDVWALGVKGGKTAHNIVPVPISPTIRTCIEIDRKNGLGDKISQLQLTPKSAVLYYLEGGLRLEHFANAIEGERCIVLRSIQVFDCNLNIVIKPYLDLDLDVATADAKGCLL